MEGVGCIALDEDVILVGFIVGMVVDVGGLLVADSRCFHGFCIRGLVISRP